jgi:5-methylcytosine-specific restriction endonuclease McrA
LLHRLAEALKQAFGLSERTAFYIVGLKSLWHHIQAERKLMTKDLWFKVMRYYNWTSAKSGIRNWENKEPGKPKMQVDRAVSLYHWGETEWSNLQVLTGPENRAKGTQDIDYRKM